MNACAKTSGAENEKLEQFYDGIEREMTDSGSKYQTISGDFNVKIGTKTKQKTEEDSKSMGAFGTRERNERGDRLNEFEQRSTK